jgi:ABC-type multidrug transport system fused ATPase/permease subunit
LKFKTLVIDHDLYTLRKLTFIIGIVSFSIEVILISLRSMNLASILFLISILFLFATFWLNEKYKVYKKVYTEFLSENYAIDILNHGSFEFTKESLNYRNKKNIKKRNWNEILKYELIDKKHLFLLNKNSELNLIISETEMDKPDFNKVLNFIRERIK